MPISLLTQLGRPLGLLAVPAISIAAASVLARIRAPAAQGTAGATAYVEPLRATHPQTSAAAGLLLGTPRVLGDAAVASTPGGHRAARTSAISRRRCRSRGGTTSGGSLARRGRALPWGCTTAGRRGAAAVAAALAMGQNHARLAGAARGRAALAAGVGLGEEAAEGSSAAFGPDEAHWPGPSFRMVLLGAILEAVQWTVQSNSLHGAPLAAILRLAM